MNKVSNDLIVLACCGCKRTGSRADLLFCSSSKILSFNWKINYI